MVWWCNKHEQHSIDDICWKCDNDRAQPLKDAFLAGWSARDNLFKPANKRWDEKRDEALNQFINKRKYKLRGIHDT